MANVIIFLVFAGIFLACLIGYLVARLVIAGGGGHRVGARLWGGSSRRAEKLTDVRKKLVFGPLTEPLASQIPQLKSESDAMEVELRRAGFYKPSARIEYLAVRNALILSIALIAAAAVAIIGPESSAVVSSIIVVACLLAVIAYSVPRLVILSIGRRRVHDIQNGLPDALDMIAMSVSGGLSLHDALENVSREIAVSHRDLAFELDLVRQQTEMGALDQALKQFAHRIDAPEVRQMSALVIQSERLGTNVVRALQDHADNIRRTQRARADERASKTGVKMLFPLSMMAISIFLLLWGPAIIELRSFYRTEQREGGALYQPDRISTIQLRRGGEELDSINSLP